MSGTVPVHSEHVDTNEQVRVQCHVIILNTIEHFLCTVQELICSLFFLYMFTTDTNMVSLVHTVCSIIRSEVHLKLQILVDIYVYYTGVTGAYYMFYIMLTTKDILHLSI